jgi:hypothetical protein
MTTDLAVIIPSRGRPESVERMAIAFAETGADELAVIWSVELDELSAYQAEVNRWFAFGEVLAGEYGAMAPSVNAASVHALNDLDPYAIAVLNDDHLPRTPGWSERYLASLLALDPCGLVYPDDGLRGAKLATTWAVHASWVRAIGRMVPARVEHLYTDDAMQNLAIALGRIVYLDDVLIEHMHPLAKDAAGRPKADTDAGYQRVNRREQHSRDRMAYKIWARSAKRRVQLAALRAIGGSS